VYTQTERKTNLLISSFVHYVHLGGDKNKLKRKKITITETKKNETKKNVNMSFTKLRQIFGRAATYVMDG